tara:strand:- start:95 stop:343 length:249 start_codon:yes stop_codon:yes gene_type:complete
MYFLGLGLLVLSTWYLLRLYEKFNDDPEAKKEISDVWSQAKKEAKGKNPFAPGRIRNALNSYKADMEKELSKQDENKKDHGQ